MSIINWSNITTSYYNYTYLNVQCEAMQYQYTSTLKSLLLIFVITNFLFSILFIYKDKCKILKNNMNAIIPNLLMLNALEIFTIMLLIKPV